MQNGGFLGLLASLGIPLISSLISGLMEKGLQFEPPRGKGLQMEPPRSYREIPFNTGAGLQMEPPRDRDKTSIIIDDLQPGKKSIGLRCSYGRGLQIRSQISNSAGSGLQMEPPRRKNRVLRCSHIYWNGNCNDNCNELKKKIKIYKLSYF